MLDGQASATETSLPPVIDSPARLFAFENRDVWVVCSLVHLEVRCSSDEYGDLRAQPLLAAAQTKRRRET